MTIDFKNISGGTVASQIGEPVVLTDGETYPYSADTIVSDVSYTRSLKPVNAWCMPFDLYIDEDVYNNVAFYPIRPNFHDTEYDGFKQAFLDAAPYFEVGTIIPANTPVLCKGKNGITSYTFHGDNRKGYVVLKAAVGKADTHNCQHIISNGSGNWLFFPVQERITFEEFDASRMYYLTSSGTISNASKPTTAVNSYRWIFTNQMFVNEVDEQTENE